MLYQTITKINTLKYVNPRLPHFNYMQITFLALRAFERGGKNRDSGNVARKRVEAFCIGNGKWNLIEKKKGKRNKFYPSSKNCK